MKNLLIFYFVMLSCAMYGQVDVIINNNPAFSNIYINSLQTFLETNTGANVDIVTLSSSNIAAADQVWIVIPDSDFSSDVINALIQALQEGKRIILVGENSGFSNSYGNFNPRLNDIAAQLGMLSYFENMSISGGCETPVLIQENPLTEGVTSPMVVRASTSEILMGINSSSLIKFEDLSTGLHDLAIVECISNGDVVMLGDVNLWYNNNCSSVSSVETFFNNIVNKPISCASEPIPTLSQWGIIALGMLSLIFGVVTLKYSTRLRLQGK